MDNYGRLDLLTMQGDQYYTPSGNPEVPGVISLLRQRWQLRPKRAQQPINQAPPPQTIPKQNSEADGPQTQH
jgi:hypothetical protein